MVYGMTSGQQTIINHHYRNTKEKVLTTNGAACFDKICRFKHLMPKNNDKDREKEKKQENRKKERKKDRFRN
jgi:hypothetical protein